MCASVGQIGHRHPDPVVENATLAAIRPPTPSYKLSLPKDIIEQRKLSALQLEAIVLASQRCVPDPPPGASP
jgi:hypothetical protein